MSAHETEKRVARRAMAHLSDDETVAKMGHPDSWWCCGFASCEYI